MGQGLQCLGGWSSWAAGAGGAGSCRLVAGVGWGRGMGGCRDRLRRGVVGRQCPEVVAVSQRSGLSLWPRRCARGLHGRGCAWCPVTTYLSPLALLGYPRCLFAPGVASWCRLFVACFAAPPLSPGAGLALLSWALVARLLVLLLACGLLSLSWCRLVEPRSQRVSAVRRLRLRSVYCGPLGLPPPGLSPPVVNPHNQFPPRG